MTIIQREEERKMKKTRKNPLYIKKKLKKGEETKKKIQHFDTKFQPKGLNFNGRV